MPQLSSDFTARSDLNTFRRLATDVKHRVSREPVYGGFGARVCPQSSPEESELAVTSGAVGVAADFGVHIHLSPSLSIYIYIYIYACVCTSVNPGIYMLGLCWTRCYSVLMRGQGALELAAQLLFE